MEAPATWDSHGDGWPDDRFLRTHKWQIASRPRRGPDLWRARKGAGWLVLTTQGAIEHVCACLESVGKKHW